MSARILVVSPYRGGYGPAEVVDHVVEALIEGGHEPQLVVPDGAQIPRYIRASKIPVHTIHGLSTFPRTLNASRLRSFLREHAAASATIAAIATRERAALVYSTSEAIFCGSLAARRTGLPSIVHAIGMSIASPRAVASVYIRLLDHLADQFVACSAAVAEMFVSHGVKDEKVVVIHNGIDIKAVDAVDAATLTGGPGKIGLIAVYDARKGHELFLEAAELVLQVHPSATFFLIGGTLAGQRDSVAFERRVDALIRDRGLDDTVVRTGFVSVPEIYRTIKALDVVVVPSATEAFAHALLEAMACAKPIVATKIEGNLDAFVERDSGLYVDRDAHQLAAALVSLLDDPARAGEMGAAGSRRVRTLFDLPATLPPIAHTVDHLLTRIGRV